MSLYSYTKSNLLALVVVCVVLCCGGRGGGGYSAGEWGVCPLCVVLGIIFLFLSERKGNEMGDSLYLFSRLFNSISYLLFFP